VASNTVENKYVFKWALKVVSNKSEEWASRVTGVECSVDDN